MCPWSFFLVPNTTFSQRHSLSPEGSMSTEYIFSFHNPWPLSPSPPLNFTLELEAESFPQQPLFPNLLLKSSEQKPRAGSFS